MLTISAPADTSASHYQVDHLRPQFQLTDQEMGVYRYITPEVNESFVRATAVSLFGIRSPAVAEEDGIFFVNSGNKTFQMDSSDGSMWYADNDILWNVAEGVGVPSPASCETTALDFLTTNDLLPEGASVTDVSPCNSTAFNIETEDTLFKTLHYQVSIGFELEGVPVTGPRAQIAVMVGSRGEIIGFDWNWWYRSHWKNKWLIDENGDVLIDPETGKRAPRLTGFWFIKFQAVQFYDAWHHYKMLKIGMNIIADVLASVTAVLTFTTLSPTLGMWVVIGFSYFIIQSIIWNYFFNNYYDKWLLK